MADRCIQARWKVWAALAALVCGALAAGCGAMVEPPQLAVSEHSVAARSGGSFLPIAGEAVGTRVERAPQTGSAKLEVEPPVLVFGAGNSEQRFTVRNAGGGVLHWSLGTEAGSPWLKVSHRFGSLNPGGETIVTVLVTRVGLPEGDHLDRIYINSNGGDADIPVWLEVESFYAGPIELALWVEKVEGNRVTIGGQVGCRGGIVTQVTWLWGDGRLEDGPAPAFPVSHVYPGSGSYPVTVTACCSSGHQRSKTVQVVIGAGG